jgi:hypothetical protein
MERLTSSELTALIRRVFALKDSDTALAIIVDLPDNQSPDHERWQVRRQLALGWYDELAKVSEAELGLPTHLYLYRNVKHNNADLPASCWLYEGGALPDSADLLDSDRVVAFSTVFATHSIMIAPTQFSATAPLKLAAREVGFRAATMPGFSPAMIPALRLNYAEINGRVHFLKELLDEAHLAEVHFRVDGKDDHLLKLDLRHRPAHASGGLLPEAGVAGNLPSGETYIVPYEGELPGDPSRSAGTIPVQFGSEVVYYDVKENSTHTIRGDGVVADQERAFLAQEPAYGNLAELGLGVLADYGLEPTGEILLDEKLALHIAFGRSDHFGGQVGAAQFSKPEAVVHIDRVYLPATMPRISIVSTTISFPDGHKLELIANDAYVVEFP